MIRRTFWQGILGCAVVALLAGCGSDNSLIPSTVVPSTVTQTVTKAAGGTITTAKSTLTIPANALSADSAITVTDSPADLPATAKTAGLVTSTKITAASGVTIASGTPLTLALPYTRTNQYPVYVYKVDGSALTEVSATPAGSGKAGFSVTSFGTYAIYNATGNAAVPGTQQPNIVSIAPQENAALYGTVRLRVSNVSSATATVTATVGGVAVTPAPTVAYTDASAPSGTVGAAVDLRVPYGLPSGAQSLVVTVNGVASPAYAINISNTNPFAVFTLDNGKKFVAELRKDKAPNTVANFVGLATGTKTWTPTVGTTPAGSPMNTPLYNGVAFHRVVPNFVWQFGDPVTALAAPPAGFTAGTGGPGFTIPFEDTGLLNVDGALAMARQTDINTGSSQVFIDNGAQTALDTTRDPNGNVIGGYAVFGLVVEGRSNLNSTYPVPTEGAGFVAGTAPTKLTSVVITGKIDSK